MSSSPATPSVRAELAASIRRANAAFMRCPEPRPEVIGDTWSALERAVDVALADGDTDRALAAIRAWEAHAMRILGGAR